MRRPPIGVQLGLAFAVVAAFTALLTAGFVYFGWQNSFESYVRERVRADAEVLADLSGTAYLGGVWHSNGLTDIARLGARSGLRVQVLDADGHVLVDNGDLLVTPMMPGMGGMMGNNGRARGSASRMVAPVVRQPVVVDGETVGAVRVASAAEGSFLTDRDLQFRTAALGGVALASILAVALATLGGIGYSRLFARPIERVTRTAAALRAGEREARTGMQGDDEIGQLGMTLDSMADSIQAERDFERRLTADVAHELRTPLQAVQATVEAMQDGVMPADPEHLQVVRDETLRLARLADSILELSRLENRAVELRMEVIDPALPLVRALDTHRALLESVGLALVEDVREGARVLGDDDVLTQAFGNLISNAAHYTPEGGTVTVRLVPEATEVRLTVSDTGIGIAENDRDHVFSRFWRGDEARERSRKGFGIGLAIVREIVERHGGSVAAIPNGEGPGTTFVVRLPLLAGDTKTR